MNSTAWLRSFDRATVFIQFNFYSQTPNNDFGKDSVPYGNYQTLWEGTGATSVDINKILSKDVCNHDTRVGHTWILQQLNIFSFFSITELF